MHVLNDPTRLAIWKRNLGFDCTRVYTRICTDHFDERHILKSAKTTRLVKHADPKPRAGSTLPDIESAPVQGPSVEVPAAEVPVAEVPVAEVPAAEVPVVEVPAAEVPADDGEDICYPELHDPNVVEVPSHIENCDVGEFTEETYIIPSLLEMSETQIKVMCGISLEILDFLCQKVLMVKPHGKERIIKRNIILTLMKLRTNNTYLYMGAEMDTDPAYISSQIRSTIIVLAAATKSLISWPDQESFANSLPDKFEDFGDVKVIVDCTEAKTSTINCHLCRRKLYSGYKNSCTVKFMVGISVSGVITFLSKAYVGCTSDKQIFLESKITDKLVEGDAVLADAGFLIKGKHSN